MRHGLECNIRNIANQLSFVYSGFAKELRVFITLPTNILKATVFIWTLEAMQEV